MNKVNNFTGSVRESKQCESQECEDKAQLPTVPEKVCPSLANAVHTIGMEPALDDYLANFIPNKAETQMIESWRYFSRQVELWLENLVLKKPLKFEGLLTDIEDYKFYAELCVENLNLARAIHPKSEWFQRNFPSSIDLWVACERAQWNWVVTASGLGTGTPVIRGKNKYLTHNRAAYKALEDCQMRIDSTNFQLDSLENVQLKMLSSGQEIAQKDRKFETDVWERYWKLHKKFQKKVKNSKDWKMLYLYQEQLIASQKNKKLPKSEKKESELIPPVYYTPFIMPTPPGSGLNS